MDFMSELFHSLGPDTMMGPLLPFICLHEPPHAYHYTVICLEILLTWPEECVAWLEDTHWIE
jgi:hypothetical protein